MFSVSYERGVVFRPVRFSVSVSNFFRFPAKMCGRTVCGVKQERELHERRHTTVNRTLHTCAHVKHMYFNHI